jgi:mannose-1-phosphate guanylyltransferase/mannose-6-phosphate isomerase
MSAEPTSLPHLHAVILAGGSGSRFWPLSRELGPKQMLSVFGGVSLITRAVQRITSACDVGSLHVITNERLLDELRNHLKSQPALRGLEIDYLAEPAARNTAPAVALAAAYVKRIDPDAVMVVLPSDHLLEDGEAWRHTIEVAYRLAEDRYLVTIGLEPDKPETGYGYIKVGQAMAGHDVGGIRGHAASGFVEKPDLETARLFLSEGDYMWNSGILVARVDVVLEELRKAGERAASEESAHGASIAETAEWLASRPKGEWPTEEPIARFAALPAVPFDKAALEVSDRVAVVPVHLEWSDVGSLLSLSQLAAPDERGNVRVGRVVDVDSRDVVAYSQDRLLATLGVKDLLVVDTPDATLIADKGRAQDVRLIVDALKAVNAPEVVAARSSLRPWGSWTLLMKSDGFQIKSIDVLPGERLSLQSHARRSEHWIVVEGVARVARDGEEIDVLANESVYLPTGTVHRLENPGPGPLKVIEVAVGEYLGEDDIVRYEDDFGR